MRSILGIIAASAIVALVAGQSADAGWGSAGVTGGDRLRVGSRGATQYGHRDTTRVRPLFVIGDNGVTTYRSFSYEPGAGSARSYAPSCAVPAPRCCVPAPRCCRN